MPRYIQPPNRPHDEELTRVMNALGAASSRSIVRYIAGKPGTRIPELARHFNKHSAVIRGVIVGLESVGFLCRVPGSARKIGKGTSHAYEVDADRVQAAVRAKTAYLLGRTPTLDLPRNSNTARHTPELDPTPTPGVAGWWL